MECDNAGLAFGYLDGIREQPESKTALLWLYCATHAKSAAGHFASTGFPVSGGLSPSPFFKLNESDASK